MNNQLIKIQRAGKNNVMFFRIPQSDNTEKGKPNYWKSFFRYFLHL